MRRELGQLRLADGLVGGGGGAQPAAGHDRIAGRLGGLRAAARRGLCGAGGAAVLRRLVLLKCALLQQ